MSGTARWATSPPQTAWMGGAPAATRARIQRGPVGWTYPPILLVPGLALRDGGQDRGPSWPGGRAQTPAKSPEWAPGRRGGPAALCLRRRRQSLRSATVASSGGDFPRLYNTHYLVWLHDCCEFLTVSVSVVLLSVVEADQNEKCVQSNGVEHAESAEDARAAICTSPVNGSTDAEC